MKTIKMVVAIMATLMVSMTAFSQTRSVTVNEDNKAAIGVMPNKRIVDFLDAKTGELEFTTVSLRDSRFSHIVEYVSMHFKSHEEAIEFFEGLSEYIGQKSLHDTYKGHRIATTKNGKWFHMYDQDGLGYATVEKKTIDWVVKSLKK